MVNVLKYYSNKKAYSKLVINFRREEIDINKVKNIAFLVDNENDIQEITIGLEKTLGVIKKNITPLVYRKKVKEEEKTPLYFTKKDFLKKGVIQSEELQKFINKDFDLLINYTQKSNLYLNLVTLLSKAKFKIGFAKIDDRLYDLMVKEPTYNVRIFHQEIYKYLSILNKV